MARIRPTSNLLIENLGIPKDYDMRRDGISQSMICSYLNCKIDFLFCVNGYRKIGSSTTTGFGSMSHYVLEHIYKHWRDENELPSELPIRDWIDEFIEDHAEDLEGKTEEEIEKDAAVQEVLFPQYIKHYENEFLTIGVVDVERTFEVDFHGYKLRGKIDGVIKKNGYKLLEHKNKGRIMSEIIQQMLPFDLQSLLYITAYESMEQVTLTGVEYNIIRNPAFGRKGESLLSLKKRLKKEIEKNPKHFFHRYPQPYTRSMKVKFRRDLLALLQEIEMFLDGKLQPFKNLTACQKSWTCKNLTACSNGKIIGYKKSPLFTELEDNA